MRFLRTAAMVVGTVFLLYCVGTVSVVWLAPESALADQLTGPLTISGNLTVYGDLRNTQDLDCDIDLNVDGDTVIDGAMDVTTATVDSLKPGSGDVLYIRANNGQDDCRIDSYSVKVDYLVLNPYTGAFPDTTTVPAGTTISRGDSLFKLSEDESAWNSITLD